MWNIFIQLRKMLFFKVETCLILLQKGLYLPLIFLKGVTYYKQKQMWVSDILAESSLESFINLYHLWLKIYSKTCLREHSESMCKMYTIFVNNVLYCTNEITCQIGNFNNRKLFLRMIDMSNEKQTKITFM